MRVQKQVQLLLRARHTQLQVIAVVRGGLRVAHQARVQFRHDIAQRGVRRQVNLAVEMHAHLAAVVSAEHRPVLDEGRVQTETGRADGGARTGHPPADHDEVIVTRVPGALCQAELLLAERRQFFQSVGRGEIGVIRKDQRIATARKAGEVVQRQRHFARGHSNRAALLPMPPRAFDPEGFGRGHTVDKHLKPAGRVLIRPGGGPVARARP